MITLFWTEGDKKNDRFHISRSQNIANHIKSETPVYFIAFKKNSLNSIKKRGFKIMDAESIKKEKYILISDLNKPEKDFKNSEYLIKESKTHISISDMGKGLNKADIIIDGHLKGTYKYKKSSKIKFYLGPDYFILNPKFRHFNKTKRKLKKKAKKVFLNLGKNFEIKLLRTITEIILTQGYSLTINWNNKEFKRQIRHYRKNFPCVKLIGTTDSIPRKYYESDISITGDEISYYEAAVTGTPSIMLYKQKYQKSLIKNFIKKEFGIKGVNLNKFNKKMFIQTLNIYKYNKKLRDKHSQKGKLIVDGQGIIRVKKIILKTVDSVR